MGQLMQNSEVVNGTPAGKQIIKHEGKNGRLTLQLSAKTACDCFPGPEIDASSTQVGRARVLPGRERKTTTAAPEFLPDGSGAVRGPQISDRGRASGCIGAPARERSRQSQRHKSSGPRGTAKAPKLHRCSSRRHR